MQPLSILKSAARSLLPGELFRRAGHWYRRVIGNRRLRRIYYFGFSRYCPVCESHLRGFVAHHDDPEKKFDSVCPVCGCKGPHRCDWLFIQGYRQRVAGPLRVLHIAPEPYLGRCLAALPDVEYVSGDIREAMGQVRFDICDLPFDEGSFDLICCVHVLMMLPDDAPAIREMFRVLRPGGVAVIENPVAERQGTLEPATAEERRRLFYDDTVLRLYGDDYRSRLSAAGFVVEEDRAGASLSLAAQRKMELYSGVVLLSGKPGKIGLHAPS
jgi:SAM-dependent methyltransferase